MVFNQSERAKFLVYILIKNKNIFVSLLQSNPR